MGPLLAFGCDLRQMCEREDARSAEIWICSSWIQYSTANQLSHKRTHAPCWQLGANATNSIQLDYVGVKWKQQKECVVKRTWNTTPEYDGNHHLRMVNLDLTRAVSLLADGSWVPRRWGNAAELGLHAPPPPPSPGKHTAWNAMRTKGGGGRPRLDSRWTFCPWFAVI